MLKFLRRNETFLWRLVLALALIGVPFAYASQNPLAIPTTGTLSGLSLVQDINNAVDSVNTMNSGASAPANQLSGSPSLGNMWLATGTGAAAQYDGANWLTAWWLDATNHLMVGFVGGGTQPNIASATTTNLCGASNAAPQQAYVNVTGTTTITSFGSQCQQGQWKRINFTGILALTYNGTSMLLPTGATITTAAGDTADAVYLGSGNWIVTNYMRATGAALSSNGLNIGASALGNSALTFSVPVNLGITASVSSNQLTVNITGNNGSAPSSSNPVLIPFRSATLATGTPTIDSLQGALGITTATTASFGCTTAVICRLWVYAVDNGGTPVIGLANCSTPSATYACNDDLLFTLPSGTTGGTSPGTIYGSTGSLSSKAVRIVGYLEAIWTSGTGWAAPTKLQLFGPGVHKPGDMVQKVTALIASSTTCAGTQTQSTVTASITPTSIINIIEVRAQSAVQIGSNIVGVVQLSRGTTPTLIGPAYNLNGANPGQSINIPVALMAWDSPATTSAQAYYLFCKSAVVAGGAGGATMEVLEIMGALDAPANDNGDDFLRLVG